MDGRCNYNQQVKDVQQLIAMGEKIVRVRQLTIYLLDKIFAINMANFNIATQMAVGQLQQRHVWLSDVLVVHIKMVNQFLIMMLQVVVLFVVVEINNFFVILVMENGMA